LTSLLSYSVVKEPTLSERAARLPDPLRPCQAECFRSAPIRSERTNPFRLARTRSLHACWGSKERTAMVTAGTANCRSRPRLCQPRRRILNNLEPPTVISGFFDRPALVKSFSACSLPSALQGAFPVAGTVHNPVRLTPIPRLSEGAREASYAGACRGSSGGSP
jgi:hypothetical protein